MTEVMSNNKLLLNFSNLHFSNVYVHCLSYFFFKFILSYLSNMNEILVVKHFFGDKNCLSKS